MVNPDVSKIFKGQLRHNATCSAGHMAIDEITPFWTLPVSMEDPTGVDNTYSVRDGFEKFFKPSSISGDKMYCDVCRDKAEATIACEMEHPPEILTLYLKRFKVDYRSTLVKNDCCVDVPHILQTENSEYELYAFVDHVGSLRGGHYTAIIKSYENQKWYLFDDTKVKQLDSQPHNDFTTSRSAYLLMYRKVHAPDTVPFLRTGGQRDNVMMKGEGSKTHCLSKNIADHWEIERSSIKLLKKLGEGSFGEVHKGLWNNTTVVAVKSLKPGSMKPQDFLKEAQIMKTMEHPNLIKLLAVCTKNEPFYIITELMENGSLVEFLYNDKGKTLRISDQIEMAAQVASGCHVPDLFMLVFVC
ncbi:proto-oncogene tyrosine-protein kinase Src-like isoform X4 [Salvelinus alpinus]